VLLTAFIAGGRLIGAYQVGREWRTWAARDPSAAEAYRTFFVVDLVSGLLSLAIAGLVWWLLRDQPGNGTDS
jgi:hypothetical protein